MAKFLSVTHMPRSQVAKQDVSIFKHRSRKTQPYNVPLARLLQKVGVLDTSAASRLLHLELEIINSMEDLYLG